MMNFTLNDINCFIETEKRKEVFPRAVFKTIAVTNFCDTPIEELMATFEVCMYVKAPQWSSKASSYQEFRHILEDGQIDILQMTSRQRLLFLTCLSDSTFKQKMMANAAENEEHFIKLRKALTIILPALRNSAWTELVHEIILLLAQCLYINSSGAGVTRKSSFGTESLENNIKITRLMIV